MTSDQQVRDTGVEIKSADLKGCRIAWGVCGGIGAVEAVRGAREIRRHEGEVWFFTTPSVNQFVGGMSLEWASTRPLVSGHSPEAYHLEEFDVVLVAPLTWNTMAKTALGLGDNAVTLLISAQFGRRKPVMFLPAMNAQLQKHPLYETYKKQLERWGGKFIEPDLEEGRLKMPDPKRLVKDVIALWKSN